MIGRTEGIYEVVGMNIVREYFIFRGRVQGVGFRYAAKISANMYGLTGWVRNRFDGSVEMELQGDRDTINRVVEDICSSRFIGVESIDRSPVPVIEDERRFRVRSSTG